DRAQTPGPADALDGGRVAAVDRQQGDPRLIDQDVFDIDAVIDRHRAAGDHRVDAALDGVDRSRAAALGRAGAGRRHIDVRAVRGRPGLVVDRHAGVGLAHVQQALLFGQRRGGAQRAGAGRDGDAVPDAVEVDVDAPFVAELALAVAGDVEVRAVGILDRDGALGVVDDVVDQRGAVVAAVDQDAVADVVDVVARDRDVLGPVHDPHAAGDRAAPGEGVIGLVGLAEDFQAGDRGAVAGAAHEL